MTLERQIAAALKWTTASKAIGQILSWVVTLVVLRLLSPDDYGLIALSSVVITNLAAVAELGLGASLVQARDISRGELARTSGALIIVNCGCMLALMLAAPLIAQVFELPQLTDVVRVCSLQFALNALDAVPQSTAYREMRFGWLAKVDLAGALVTSLSTLALAIYGAGVWSLAFGGLAGGVVRTLLLLTQGTRVVPEFSFLGMSRHLRFGGAVTLGRLLWQLAHQFDVVIIGKLLTQEALGLYAVASQLASMPLQKAMSIVNQVAFPGISRLQDDLPRLRTRLIEAIRLLFLVSIPALWGLSAVSSDMVEVLLGERWLPVAFPLQVMGLVAPLRMLSAILSTATTGVGRADLDLRNTLVLLFVLPVAFLCGVQWGVDGVATAWLVAVPLAFAINWHRNWLALEISLWRILSSGQAPIIAGIGMYAAVWVCRGVIDGLPALARLPIEVGAGAVVYLGIVSILDRGMWTDVRRLLVAVRG